MADMTPVKSDNPADNQTPPNSPGCVDVDFPPGEEGDFTLIGGVEKKKVLLREGCCLLYGTTRMKLEAAMDTAFLPHNYYAGFGQITTPGGIQNVTPDCILASGIATYPVLGEVGQSQSEEKLNARAHLLLGSVPGARVVILVKIFDTDDAENGRMVAWCASHDAARNLVLSAGVEFGRVGRAGAVRTAWTAGTPAPVITVPAHDAVPPTDVRLDGILTRLRAGGGIYWKHAPPP